ncbi:MAG TPA: DUF3750 domain-containing protein [Beijerinckiaceae bacterium]|jgi:hypothetical protein
MTVVRVLPLVLFLLFVTPLAVRAALYWADGSEQSWARADWSSAGLLPAPAAAPQAMVRIYSARVGRWRGIFATHSWIVVKDRGATSYQRFDKVGWGAPIRVNGYAPDGRWFGNELDLVFAADGADAEALIPRIRAAVEAYAFRNRGDYVAWPGPNSNTFVAAVVAAIPEAGIALPPTAIGKDYPLDERWFSLAPSRTGVRFNAGGYLGVTLAWVEGLEINLLGGVLGLDLRRPALKLPGVGRIGV